MLPREAVDEVLRAQQIWDSTMADSTLQALHDATQGVVREREELHQLNASGLLAEQRLGEQHPVQ